MPESPFHIMYKAKKLSSYSSGRDSLIPAFASSDILVYPYQVAAAMFALRSPFQKGVIECSEGGLGKSYVALLIILRQWYAGKRKSLLIIPSHLRPQWRTALDEKVNVPAIFLDSNAAISEFEDENPFEQDALVITTYDLAVQYADYLSQIKWDTVMFDEAHRLCKSHTEDAKEARILKTAVGEAFKILLTATPIQLNIMDLYGLIYFIDETALPEADAFYKRYFRKPENYPELAERVSGYCFRTLRSQAKQFAGIPERLNITVEFDYTTKEKELYARIEAYLKRPVKAAFPKMDPYELALMFYSGLASSVKALAQTLEGVVRRLRDSTEIENCGAELQELEEMLDLAGQISSTAKGKTLLKCLDVCIRELKKRGANKKALIFTDSRATQKYLKELLGKKYAVATYHAGNSRDDIIAKFRDKADILIATDLASDGLNFEFCSLVVNYDLAYNTLKLEQRIDRCHRLCQKNDVVVLSLINRNNFADVRMLELVGKRTLLMDGVFGLTDDVIGGFIRDIETQLPVAFEKARTKQEVTASFAATLAEHETANRAEVEAAEEVLFTTFRGAVAKNLHITPQYVDSKVKEINDDLWDVIRWFFSRHQHFMVDDETRSIRTFHNPAPHVFTGTRLGRDEYSMLDKSLPKSGWITIDSKIAQNVLYEIFWQGLASQGDVTVDGDIPSCKIGMYEVTVSNGYFGGMNDTTLVGKTRNEKTLTDRECRKIMELPVLDVTTYGSGYGQKDGDKYDHDSRHELDDLIDPNAYITRRTEETEPAIAEEITRRTLQTQDKKLALQREMERLKAQLAAPQEVDSVAEKIIAEKRKTTLTQELKRREQTVFMDGMRLDVALEEQIQKLMENTKLKAKVKRLFLINVTGGKKDV